MEAEENQSGRNEANGWSPTACERESNDKEDEDLEGGVEEETHEAGQNGKEEEQKGGRRQGRFKRSGAQNRLPGKGQRPTVRPRASRSTVSEHERGLDSGASSSRGNHCEPPEVAAALLFPATLAESSSALSGVDGRSTGRAPRIVEVDDQTDRGGPSAEEDKTESRGWPRGSAGEQQKASPEALLLFNPRALQGYILVCCQASGGGLIDKPGKKPDFYHTCYCLSGLSLAQHVQGPDEPPAPGAVVGSYALNRLEPTDPLCNVQVDKYREALRFFRSSQNGL
eukprot:TRINITY_DN1943_c0_g1_i1.p2 TRINITY_DN1943_c0_g1~~TRINITY_DN1943_c0_g1_i1.p2  ORF type:complete len:283 (-),score=53.65 TRINITY_DN1943_c0_g1_i1:160-1008(-)